MAMKTDIQFQCEVEQELRSDVRINAAEIGVMVHDGVVTLEGSVCTFAEREVAEEAALRVGGVHTVANEIHVCVPGELTHSDAELAHAVRTALERQSLIPSDRITISVSCRAVTLHGTVASWQQVAEAESIVANLPGVRDVISKLSVDARQADDRSTASAREALDDSAAHGASERLAARLAL
jgi:osmotically-inducible protein OsmY